jgi:hypothetical protein
MIKITWQKVTLRGCTKSLEIDECNAPKRKGQTKEHA